MNRAAFAGCLGIFFSLAALAADDPLPSWNEGATKRAILDFVACATNKDCPDFIPPEERIAVFDNDGTLWSEQPAYFQLLFAIDRVKALADKHPQWKEQEPFSLVLKGDHKALAATGVPLQRHDTLEAATRWCFEQAHAGDAVLLSPACASLDMFRNYGHRAAVFVAAVRELAAERGEVTA